jgi:hypothetical protein
VVFTSSPPIIHFASGRAVSANAIRLFSNVLEGSMLLREQPNGSRHASSHKLPTNTFSVMLGAARGPLPSHFKTSSHSSAGRRLASGMRVSRPGVSIPARSRGYARPQELHKDMPMELR